MNNDYRSKDFKNWLDRLQRESWQLELIISGFAIYGLFSAIDPIDLKAEMALVSGNFQAAIAWAIITIAQYILLFNLLLHVLLRGLWIGAIGLRYVSGDINYENLNYSEKFTFYLKRKVGSFDGYISNLENYCSVLFSVSFLLIFYVIGAVVAVSFISILLLIVPMIFGNTSKWVSLIGVILVIIFILIILIVFIDFIGQGFLKRKKWTSKIYFPIFKFFGFVTLSFLYRPLIYNFLDNRFGKRLSVLLVPIYALIVIISTVENSNSNYIGIGKDSSSFYSDVENYENLSKEKGEFIKIAAIQSKVITTNFLKVFLLHSSDLEDYIYESNEELRPKNDNRGFYTEAISGFKDGFKDANGIKDTIDTGGYLKELNHLYQIKIDLDPFESDFVASRNTNERLGFETYFSIQNLSDGKHILTIIGPTKANPMNDESETIVKTLVTIPFWYFPENSNTPVNNQIIEVDSLTNK